MERKVHKHETRISAGEAFADLRSAGLSQTTLRDGIEIPLVSGSNDSVNLVRRGDGYFRVYRNW